MNELPGLLVFVLLVLSCLSCFAGVSLTSYTRRSGLCRLRRISNPHFFDTLISLKQL